jgi:DNA-binding NarL/FixJ family response regulator
VTLPDEDFPGMKYSRVLTVLSDSKLAADVQHLLSRRNIEVNRVPTGTSALILTGNLGYDLIIIEHPLSDLATGDFLASIHTLDSTNTGSPVLVVCDEDDQAELGDRIADDLVETVSRDADVITFHTAVSSLLGVAARCAARVMVQIGVGLQDEGLSKVLQSENLSESGVLLRGGRGISVGSKVRFEFTLPTEIEPVTGVAHVVRHTVTREAVEGIALHFTEISELDILRLRRFTVTTLDGRPGVPSSAAEAQSGAPE